jgi:hypothetical protein
MTADGPKMASRITTVSAWTAHALAWAPGVWLLFAPSYRGVSETILPDGSTEVTRHTATFVETNGLIVVSWLLVPVLLTYIALAATHFVEPGRAKRKILLWCPAVALLVLCMLTIFSFGMIYLLVALALFIAAVTDSRGRAAK